jgi:hypothetical protein
MDAAERALLEETVRDAIVAGRDPRASAGVDDVLAGLGWHEMLHAEDRDPVDIVFRALGATNAMSSALDDVVVSALGVEPRPDLAVLLPPFTAWGAPGSADGDGIVATGVATARVASAAELLVVCSAGAEIHVAGVRPSVLDVTPVRGIDPDAALQTVRVEDGAATSAIDPAAWDSAVAAGRSAVAYQVAGACNAMLALAREHALARIQFDRPIARFQAVRHRLANALVGVEALEATLVAAADEPSMLTTALAKAVAGRTALTVGAECQQVLAGIGFTTDHPFHRLLKRTMVLDGILGSADAITLDVGRQLLADRRVPTLIDL